MGNFALRAKRAVRTVAAVSISAAMLGATLAGAFAADLSEYPKPFTGSDAAIIIGSSADSAAASDIALGLPKTTTDGGKEGGQVSEEVPLGMGIANSTTSGFDWEVDDSDVSSFQDTKISFQSKDYDIHDEIVLAKDTPNVATSLSSKGSTQDDYEDNVFLEVAKRGAIGYYIVFDDALNASKATTSNALEVKFLGKTLKITNVDTSDTSKFTAYVGNNYFMNVGDSITIDGKKVKLENVGSGGAILISVDGVMDTIASSNSKVVNGIEISNDQTFYEDNKAQRAASLILGKNSQDTYKDGDAYTGEDENDPDWVWDTSNLANSSTTSVTQTTPGTLVVIGPRIGIVNEFVRDSASDNPAGMGECVALPNKYAQICLDSLTVPADNYLTVTIEMDSSADTAKSGNAVGGSNQGAIYIKAPGDERFLIRGGDYDIDANSTTDRKTSEIWIASTGDVPVDGAGQNFSIYYKDADKNPNMRYAGVVRIGTVAAPSGAGPDDKRIFELNYGKSKEKNINVSLGYFNYSTNLTQLYIDVNADSTSDLENVNDDIVINFSLTNHNISALGLSKNTEEEGEIAWNPNSIVQLGKKDENHRSRYGIIIVDPKSNGASDKVILKIPDDQVKANVVIKGVATTSGGSSTSSVATLNAQDVSDVKQYNAILVGGPCANPLTAQVMDASKDWPACASGYTTGEAIIELRNNGDKMALIVAGYNADDTRRAGIVLREAGTGASTAAFLFDGKLPPGTSKTVKGTSLEVSGIDVV
ncbi:MAG: hypothetical protein AB1571_04225 [Nanoarchaeota archaeon]